MSASESGTGGSTFTKAFILGLIVGVVVGGFAGAFLPPLIEGVRTPTPVGNRGAAKPQGETRDEGRTPAEVKPGDVAPETPDPAAGTPAGEPEKKPGEEPAAAPKTGG